MPDYTWERWDSDMIHDCFHKLYWAVDTKTGIIRYAHTLEQENELTKYFKEDFLWRLWKFNKNDTKK